jgi:hypothetical protein
MTKLDMFTIVYMSYSVFHMSLEKLSAPLNVVRLSLDKLSYLL